MIVEFDVTQRKLAVEVLQFEVLAFESFELIDQGFHFYFHLVGAGAVLGNILHQSFLLIFELVDLSVLRVNLELAKLTVFRGGRGGHTHSLKCLALSVKMSGVALKISDFVFEVFVSVGEQVELVGDKGVRSEVAAILEIDGIGQVSQLLKVESQVSNEVSEVGD